jgi:hypothetical protein
MKRSVDIWVRQELGVTKSTEVHRGDLNHQRMGGLTTGWYHVVMLGGKFVTELGGHLRDTGARKRLGEVRGTICLAEEMVLATQL